MAAPWLTVIGIGEDGLAGLPEASRARLGAAEVVFGGARHLALAGVGAGRARRWPVPFDPAPVLAVRGRRVAVLASGDPFWHGAGGSLAALLDPGEWISLPAPSTFALAANRLGWRLEETLCLGLHAQPFARARPHLTRGARLICLMRDGAAVADFAAYLGGLGFGASPVAVLERLGGPAERIRHARADALPADITAPVAVALEVAGAPGLPRGFGLDDDLFAHDGQITRAAIRAVTLCALAPRPGALLWDIGAGSGSVSVEWCLAGGRALAVEPRPDRLAHVRRNAEAFGVDHRLTAIAGRAPEAIAALPAPAAVFLGGGASEAVLAAVWDALPTGGRLVANAVTLETEALLSRWQGARGGRLLRLDLAEAAPLGRLTGWVPQRPVVQWSVTR
ncbi:MAG: precorrin-6y C5,15-methyltransferase (decarboxylating) subunit CbiE [Gemmobacter sp.]